MCDDVLTSGVDTELADFGRENAEVCTTMVLAALVDEAAD